jgi:hypothetical protein
MALATVAISTIVLVPSTKAASILGFISLRSASSATDSGVAVGSRGLFLPFPTATTSKPIERAKS